LKIVWGQCPKLPFLVDAAAFLPRLKRLTFPVLKLITPKINNFTKMVKSASRKEQLCDLTKFDRKCINCPSPLDWCHISCTV